MAVRARVLIVRAVALLGFMGWAAAFLVACGRRATEADCRLIVDRSVELQMHAMSESDPAAIADRERQVRAALEGDIHSCESRRVTDRIMACVRRASTAEELEECLR